MEKSLKTIQVISKIGKIISIVVNVLSWVGAVGCLIGIVSLICNVGEIFKIGGISVRGIIELNTNASIATMYTAMAVGMIVCIGEIILSRLAINYFKHELEAGTPFTLSGAKEMFRLGIFTICIPSATVIVAGIVREISSHSFGQMAEMEIDGITTVALGITFLILSLVFKYGAQVAERKQVECAS